MIVRRVTTLVFFLVLAFLFFRQDPVIIEDTETSPNYRFELTDSFSVFYFQCPELKWEVEGASALQLNDVDWALQGQQTFCQTQSNWEIFTAAEEFITVSVTRTIFAKSALGLCLFALFLALFLGCFKHSTIKWDGLAVFSFLWAIAYIMHLISYEYFRTSFLNGSIVTFFAILAAILVLSYPKSITALVLLAMAHLFEYYVISPFSSNHTLTLATVNLVILLAIGISLFQQRGKPFNRELFYETFAPVIRSIVLILYFWAWFHKLNSSFIEPSVSCAVQFYGVLHGFYPIFPQGDWVNTLVIWMTFFVEGGLPILLLFPRTRFIAILIGIGFHGLLGLTIFRDFSGLMFVLYFSFVSESGVKTAQKLIPRAFSKIPAWLKQALWAWIIIALVMSLPGIREEQYRFLSGIIANITYVVLFGSVVFYWLYRQWFKHDNTLLAPLFRPVSPLLWIIPPLLILNGAMPYIGLKTNNSYDMYSNLRVEAGSNHFLFPAYGQIFDYPNDLVQIVDSSDDYFLNSKENHLDFVFWEFREQVYAEQPEFVVFMRNGQIYRVERGNYEAILGLRAPNWLRKLIIFEPVSQNEFAPCSH